MSLPIEWVEKIFKKLTISYGVEFLNRYKGVPLVDVKTDWSEELRGFGGESISYALTHLPDRPPTAQQFKHLCISSPAQEAPRIEMSVAGKARIESELAKMDHLRTAQPVVDFKAWAKRLVANPEMTTPTTLRMAKDALGMA